jgi:ribonuclease HII
MLRNAALSFFVGFSLSTTTTTNTLSFALRYIHTRTARNTTSVAQARRRNIDDRSFEEVIFFYLHCVRIHETVLHCVSRDVQKYWGAGVEYVIGVDEAGRGPIAGPVVAAACAIPQSVFIEGVRDSKQLTPQSRDKLFAALTSSPLVHWAYCAIEIYEREPNMNILEATMHAMKESVSALISQSELPLDRCYALVDGGQSTRLCVPSHAVVGGDRVIYPIAAASILAKVTRDRIMLRFHEQWPYYGFDANKGYPSKNHLSAIAVRGPCPIHRLSFSPLKHMRIQPPQ